MNDIYNEMKLELAIIIGKLNVERQAGASAATQIAKYGLCIWMCYTTSAKAPPIS